MQNEARAIATSSTTKTSLHRFYDLRYVGQSYELTTPGAEHLAQTLTRFHELHQQRFGHSHPDQPVQIVAVRIKAILQPSQPEVPVTPLAGLSADHALIGERLMTFASGEQLARVYDRIKLRHGNRLAGPALLVQSDSTFLLPPAWEGSVDAWGNVQAQLLAPSSPNTAPNKESYDPISLEIFKHLLASAAEEMGVTLGRTAYSPNIKERKDYSCACFTPRGA